MNTISTLPRSRSFMRTTALALFVFHGALAKGPRRVSNHQFYAAHLIKADSLGLRLLRASHSDRF